MPRLALTRLEDRQTPAILFATGSGGGIEAMVWLTLDHDPVESATAVVRPPSVFFPFPGFTGGVRVAMGDVTGDGTADVIAAAGAGGSPHIKVFDGLSGIEVRSFYAFDPVFTGGLSVASADNDRDGVCDIVVGADAGGGPHVQVFSGATGKVVRSFFAFAPTFSGGVAVSAADVNNDGFADVAVGAGTGGGPRVSLFDGYSGEVLQNFFAFDPTFTGGVSVAVADLAGDGDIQVVVGAGQNGGPRVRTFDLNGAEFGSFYAFDPGFLGGVNVAAADLDGDRLDDLIVGQASGGAAIRAFHGATTEQIFEQTQTGNGATAAGPLSSANGGTGAEDATDFPNIPVLDRLAVFNPDTGTFGRVTTGSIPSDKNIYVVSHGWAPGYKPWVDAYYKATGKILKVWQTAPNDPDYPTTNKFNTTGLPPAGGFLFDGMPPPSNTNGVVVSPAGLAAILAENDPNAVVLAFSWLDESATDGIISGVDSITGDVNVSEAHTTQNGIRLAQAIEQAIGSGNTSRIHLFGHSHGSKVVSVAAVELSDNGRAPTQVTIADSPEDALTQSFEAANFNWYFLQ